jgi:uncharacterized protein (TIGR02391 family)
MKITEQETQIAWTVVARLINLGEATHRKALLRKFKNADAIDQLLKKSFFNSFSTDLYLPLPMAFQHCGDNELLAKARQATETALWVLQNLDEAYPEKQDGVFTFDELANHAGRISDQKPDTEMLHLGLSLATNFGIFRHWAGAPITSFGLHESIVTINPTLAWAEYIKAREAAVEGAQKAAITFPDVDLMDGFVRAAYPFPLNPPGDYEYHPEIKRVSDKLLSEGNFRQAVLDAFIHVIAQVKERTGLQNEGDDLMNRSFSPDNRFPLVQFNDLRNEADKSEQRGIWNLFKGIVGLRNFKAHIVKAFDNPHRAHEYLALASLLLRLLDNATVNNAPPQPQPSVTPQGAKPAQRARPVEILARGTGPDGPTLSREPSIHQGLTALSTVFTIITYTAQPITVTAKRLVVDGTELKAELFFQLKSRAKDASIVMRGNDREENRFYIRMPTNEVPTKRLGVLEFEIEGHDERLTVNIQFPG